MRNKQDFWAGIFYIFLGLFFAIGAHGVTIGEWVLIEGYPMGTPRRMDAGFLPFWLGVVLATLGLILVIVSIIKTIKKSGEIAPIAPFDFKIIIIILGAVTLFGLLLNHLGLYVSIFVVIMLSSMASHEYSFRYALLNSVILIALSHFVFVKGLGLIFPLGLSDTILSYLPGFISEWFGHSLSIIWLAESSASQSLLFI